MSSHLLHMGTSQPPNQQGQEQSISQAALAIFKGDVELLEMCVALTGFRMESPTHWEPLCSVVSYLWGTGQHRGTSPEAEAIRLLPRLPQSTVRLHLPGSTFSVKWRA